WRVSAKRRVDPIFMSAVLVVVSFSGAAVVPFDSFGKLQLMTWVMFVHIPVFLLVSASLLFRQQRAIAWGCIGITALLLLVGVDAFLIEPHWLEVSHVTIPTAKLEEPVRVVVIADLQTDTLGEYEERVFREVKAAEPDLILFAGDYLHLADQERYLELTKALNTMLREAELEAPLGIYAVSGNVDWFEIWQDIFADLPITTIDATTMLDLGPVVLTGLSLGDSATVTLAVEAEEKYHIVLGHLPNFSLGQVDADLLIAGHTHGGQVQIPFLGPIKSLSAVPRSWASGVTYIEPEKVLVVSRGVGLERMYAPRLRFLCRPELVILDLVPDPGSAERQLGLP
ncbi:MAG: metallophosphoesterase, partial [Anaerolineae bacterium]|nr:metallophosphoesterase [Anaerolineae bacterium]